MNTIGAAKFREQCLTLLDRLEPEGIIVTKRGKPIARVIPYSDDAPSLIGSLRHKMKISGNIFTTGAE